VSVVQKKVCMLGAYSVGKTSLVSQYVNSIFSEKYTTTIGVKIDKKQSSACYAFLFTWTFWLYYCC